MAKKYDDETLVKRLINVSWIADQKNPAFYSYRSMTFNGEKYNAFQNGYYIFAVKDETYGYYETKDFKVDSFFSDFEKYPNEYSRLVLPVNEIKAAQKESKAERGAYGLLPGAVILGDDKALGYNPFYMKDCYDFFGNNTAYIYTGTDHNAFTASGAYKDPIFFKSNDGKKIGLLMPVNLYAIGVKRNAA